MGTYANFYNSDNNDRVYNADSFSEWLRPFFKNGVFNGELQVVADTGMNVKVRTGNAYIDGKMKNFENETTLTLEKASANSTRIDSVVVRRNDTERDFSILVVKGSTSAPDPVRQEGIYDLVLAQITVGASVTEIKQANITDTRMNADLCGWVVTNIDEIDFSQITAQWSNYIVNFEAEQLQAFQTWFDTIKGQLGSDVAGSLQTQINNINSDISSLQSTVSTNTSDINSTNAKVNELSQNVSGLQTDVSGLQESHVITLGTTWTSEGNYYTQTVTLNGIADTDQPLIDNITSGTIDNVKSLNNEWSKVFKAETVTNGIKFYATSQTTKALTLLVKMGIQTKSDGMAIETVSVFANAGSHNAIYRGKFLGNSVTDAQYQALKDGTFTDLFIGDYWTIGGVNYRIASFDYFMNCGNTATTEHHAVIVPDSSLYNHVMNDTNITTGGYVGSKMYTEGLEQAKTTIKAAFSGHVLKHRELLVNATVDGKPSGWAWFDSEVELMNEVMVYGSVAWGAHDGNGYNVASGNGQFHLFSHDHSRAHNRNNWWLRDVVSAARFAGVGSYGSADYAGASNSFGVRPAFCIYGGN